MSPFPEIDFKAELNDEQYAAVTAPPGPALVLAGAGSGKTRTLTYRVAYLLHQGVQAYEILLLTFTNKASHEMLERVEDLTGVPRRALWGGTFHSIAQRILRVHGDLVGLKPICVCVVVSAAARRRGSGHSFAEGQLGWFGRPW